VAESRPLISQKLFLVAVLSALIGAATGAVLALHLRPQPAPIVLAPEPAPEPELETSVSYLSVEMTSLPGWSQDKVLGALPALRRSCRHFRRKAADSIVGENLIARPASDWHFACGALTRATDEASLREVLRKAFSTYSVSSSVGEVQDPRGTFTGYYEADLKGSLTRGGVYQTPIYGPPRDLVTINLKDFAASAIAMPKSASGSLVGRVIHEQRGNRLKPYYSRAEIDAANAIANDAAVLVWAEDPVDVHILHIQGSGRVTLPDGHVIRIGFAGHNGRSFRGIGGILLRAGVLKSGQGSMISVRDWLRRHPEQAAEYMNQNTRYIFFRQLDPTETEDGPIGAFGVSLTPMRSIAVDPRFVPLGAPVWIDTHDPDGEPLQRLVSAQDVGSAIKGEVRGDFFWGAGAAAFSKAGRMKSEGRYFVFVPKQQNR
jgi:membrane-bound lytic murein transglycosylase A